jgi:outer membrane protein
LAAAACLSAVAGCGDIEAARKAQDPASAGPGERTATAAELGLGPGTTLTIERGLQLSLEQNPSVAIARRAVDAARARLTQAEAGSLPTLSASASYDVAGGKNRDTKDAFSTNLSARILLYDFGRQGAIQRESAEQLIAAAQDLGTAEIETSYAFEEAFYGVLRQIELVGVAEQNVRQFEKRLEQVRGFVEVGTRVKYDLTKAQVDLGNAQLTLVTAKTALAVQQAVLGNVLGLAEPPVYALDKPVVVSETAPEAETLMTEARRQHPRLLARAARERAASHAVDASVAALFPELSLGGSLTAAGALSPVDWFGSVGPTLDWILFSGWAQTGQLRETVAALQATRAARAQAEQLVFLEIQQAIAAREDARQRLSILELTVRQAEENLDLIAARYRIGKASSVELTDAQVALATSRGQQVQADYNLRIAAAQIRRAAGFPPAAAKKAGP